MNCNSWRHHYGHFLEWFNFRKMKNNLLHFNLLIACLTFPSSPHHSIYRGSRKSSLSMYCIICMKYYLFIVYIYIYLFLYLHWHFLTFLIMSDYPIYPNWSFLFSAPSIWFFLLESCCHLFKHTHRRCSLMVCPFWATVVTQHDILLIDALKILQSASLRQLDTVWFLVQCYC